MGRPTGVTVIAILDFLGAGLCILFGLSMVVGGGFLASIINRQGGQGSAEATGILAGIGAVFGIISLIGPAIDIVLAIGLLKSPSCPLCFIVFCFSDSGDHRFDPRSSALISGKLLLFRSPDHRITRDHPICSGFIEFS